MKKTYMTPLLKVESAEITSIICTSFDSNVGISGGSTGNGGEAHTKEEDWDIWGEE